MGLLNNKKILITGISNKYSIAYGIAKSMYREGAKLAFSYQHDKLKLKVKKIALEFNSNIVFPCDVSKDSNIQNLFDSLYKKWKKYDGFVHSIAYSPKNQLSGQDYVNSINRKDFSITHDISSYSFVAMAKISRSMLNSNSSLVTLTYFGSNRVIPNYNIMGLAKASLEANTKYMANSMGKDGIRVNAISSGPIKTLSSSGIKNFKKILHLCKKINPISRLITTEDIGNVAVFLCSDLSSGITGEILNVNGGFNIFGIYDINNK
ncbi:MAG: enoyl-[acyl-carrier-protein] reductase [Candidatus Westeberhardia cardiocondylae]|nr:enoyl-[acyl-carrier-protein] reductase [Candidatus Westeberhardia cardiocondylae]